MALDAGRTPFRIPGPGRDQSNTVMASDYLTVLLAVASREVCSRALSNGPSARNWGDRPATAPRVESVSSKKTTSAFAIRGQGIVSARTRNCAAFTTRSPAWATFSLKRA